MVCFHRHTGFVRDLSTPTPCFHRHSCIDRQDSKISCLFHALKEQLLVGFVA